jgi:hypothetical protein
MSGDVVERVKKRWKGKYICPECYDRDALTDQPPGIAVRPRERMGALCPPSTVRQDKK